MDNLKYCLILIKSKINKKLQRRYYIIDDKYDSIVMKRFGDMHFTEYTNMVYIDIDSNMAKEKKVLLKIIKRLVLKGKKVYLYEQVKTFTDEDIVNLYKLSKNIVFFDKYMENSKEIAANQILEVDISSYVLIIDKLNYFQKVCEHYCKTDLDKVIFTVVQLANYVKYGYYSRKNSCLESCFLLNTGVCIDIAIGFWKCLDRLGIESSIIKGIGNKDTNPNLSALVRADHAWNQVKINGNWYNLDLTWYMSSKDTKYILVDDEKFYNDKLHNTVFPKHYCRYSQDNEYIKKKIEEYSAYNNVFKQYSNGTKIIY